MVISVSDALQQRIENCDIQSLVTAIDEFLATPEAEEKALNLGDVSAPARRHIRQLYTAVGWEVEWDEDGNLWITPNEDHD